MNPTTEQLESAEWWKANVDDSHDYAYTTGPDWDYDMKLIGTISFADKGGCIDGVRGLIVDSTAWVLLCERPVESTGFIPEVGTWCEFLDNTLAHPQWRKCKPRFIGVKKIIYDTEHEEESYTLMRNLKFRPLKTEREKFIEKASETPFCGIENMRNHYGDMFDNGAIFTEAE